MLGGTTQTPRNTVHNQKHCLCRLSQDPIPPIPHLPVRRTPHGLGEHARGRGKKWGKKNHKVRERDGESRVKVTLAFVTVDKPRAKENTWWGRTSLLTSLPPARGGHWKSEKLSARVRRVRVSDLVGVKGSGRIKNVTVKL